MVTASKGQGVTTRQDWERWELYPQGYRKCLPLVLDDVELAAEALCACGWRGLIIHAYKRSDPWGYVVLWECPVCRDTQSV